MQAVRITEFGDLSNVKATEVPKPDLQHGECLVRVLAAGINPSDVKNAQGGMTEHTTLPRILGRDFAGVVEEGPTEWVGKEVYGSGGDLGFSRDGSHAQFLAVSAKALAPKPKNLTMAQAAAIGTPFVTAWSAIVERGQVKEGERVAVWGAAGAVGSAACQIVKAHKARPIGVVRDAEQPQFTDEFTSDGSTLKDIDLVLNVIGGETIGTSIGMLRHYGRVVIIASTKDRNQPIDILSFYRHDLSLLGLNTLSLSAEDCGRILNNMVPGFESGALKPPAVYEMPLDNAHEAYKSINLRPNAKLVLVPTS
jgi:NADPH:quinone reductase-like Zn-dependent oxidoreductase